MKTGERTSQRGQTRRVLSVEKEVLVFSPSASLARKLEVAEETELVSMFLQGEEKAFEELVRRYQTRLFNFIYRTVGDRERSEDLVQEVFIRVWRNLHRFDRSKKFSTWIYTIASNLAKNELRNRSRNPLVFFAALEANNTRDYTELPLQFEDSRLGPERLLQKRDLRVLVEDAIARMTTPHFREVFILRELEGRSYEEIAQITGVNLGTVKSRLNRARNAFVAIIGPYIA